ncbi:beta-d-glucoside glucohydrolase D [Penicillium argentinense]|uniref:beta-glucosidase n=1 Tax=Penicillium argentinense TaxID=1131581 RepID=A0A9W9KLD3_9EURO|nr:beta-d-glucoside glucohydrolase D [Penicillium argentinense]KAJ5109921.1 beta-d-glucoside glucohydrolase D [Penicillium argentinense]
MRLFGSSAGPNTVTIPFWARVPHTRVSWPLERAPYEEYSQNSDAYLVFINALTGEGRDHTELYNDQQDKMINTVADNCNNTMVIVSTVGARLVDQCIEYDNITAVLYSFAPRQESGNSIIDVLYSDFNPSVRLNYTIAKNESDYNVHHDSMTECDFTVSYFNSYNITPRYPVGRGLSYTKFSYADLNIPSFDVLSRYPRGSHSVAGPADLWDKIGNISVTISNTGDRAGAKDPSAVSLVPRMLLSSLSDSFVDSNVCSWTKTAMLL